MLAAMPISWTRQHHDQLDWYWRTQFRRRLDGLDDEEYLWEPVAGCWSVRPRGESRAPRALGAGEYLIDESQADLDPAPVTTIAWRLSHLIVGCFAMRLDYHFGGPRVYRGVFTAGYAAHTYAATAEGALGQLDAVYSRWSEAVRNLSDDDLAQPSGEIAEEPLSTLILHINREVMHHGGEIALLRDLYRAQFPNS
jgi:hypothetical protein